MNPVVFAPLHGSPVQQISRAVFGMNVAATVDKISAIIAEWKHKTGLDYPLRTGDKNLNICAQSRYHACEGGKIHEREGGSFECTLDLIIDDW